jgi:spermidine synthase
MGTVDPLTIDVDAIDQRLRTPEYARMAQSLSEIGMMSAVDLFSTYAGKRPDLDPWMSDAIINRDRNLRLQYLAGLGLNLYQSDVIYADMLKHAARYPEELFSGSPATIQSLRQGIAREQGR